MHYSQNGAVDPEWGSNGPYSKLTVTSCVGCHSATDGATWKNPVTGAPIVYNTQAPTYGNKYKDGPNQGLGGGNFYFVEHVHDNRGHNVFANNPDDDLSQAPGNIKACGGPNPCHYNLHGKYDSPGSVTAYWGRQGCTKCHMYISNPETSPNGKSWHHLVQTTRIVGGVATGNWYRFLVAPHTSSRQSGVWGREDPDWEYTRGPAEHNGYAGGPVPDESRPLTSGTIDGFCSGCHFYFCSTWGSSPFHKHPAAMVIPNEGEYANAYGAGGSGTGTYDPLVPVSQTPLAEAANPNVTLGTHRVLCLTCHRAHGSPYPDMLRWDYDDMQSGNPAKTGGCFSCHSQKNDAL